MKDVLRFLTITNFPLFSSDLGLTLFFQCHLISAGCDHWNTTITQHHRHWLTKDLITRVILLSGSALSPWAIQREPLIIKRRVAEQTGCHGDLLLDDLAPCLRNKSVKELLSVSIDSPR